MYYNFNPKLPHPFNKIHPYHLPFAQKNAENNFSDAIDFIILFGGSLSLTCDKYSDIDLYVITKSNDMYAVYKEVKDFCVKLNKPFDIIISTADDYLNNYTELGTVEHDIEDRGVCIYAKNKEIYSVGYSKS